MTCRFSSVRCTSCCSHMSSKLLMTKLTICNRELGNIFFSPEVETRRLIVLENHFRPTIKLYFIDAVGSDDCQRRFPVLASFLLRDVTLNPSAKTALVLRRVLTLLIAESQNCCRKERSLMYWSGCLKINSSRFLKFLHLSVLRVLI